MSRIITQFALTTTLALGLLGFVAYYTDYGLIGYVVAAAVAGAIGRYVLPTVLDPSEDETDG